MTIAVIFGGPSYERGVSINSARTVVDQLIALSAEVSIYYVDVGLCVYSIQTHHLYSNTPDDFDFKRDHVAKLLSPEALKQSLQRCHLIFPLIHGEYGEGGELFDQLVQWGLPYVGSDISIARRLYNKCSLQATLKQLGYPVIPQLAVDLPCADSARVQGFLSTNQAESYIVKPQAYGSSIGVKQCFTVEAIMTHLALLTSQYQLTSAVVEPYMKGQEFTVIVLSGKENQPIALIPTEICKHNEQEIFDYRKKYLPTESISWMTPPTFGRQIIESIRQHVESVVSQVGRCDYLRVDGWYCQDKQIYFSDVNPVSGMENNSFLFHQTAYVGLDHLQTIYRLVDSACNRHQIDNKLSLPSTKRKQLKKIPILFGGNCSERQVSLMSGLNVYLKLIQSNHYQPALYLLENETTIWQLPEHYALYHSVEDIIHNCYSSELESASVAHYQTVIREQLQLEPIVFDQPMAYSLEEWLATQAKEVNPYVFIALHGGIGENGDLQKKLELFQIRYNGSRSEVSNTCIDKFKTSVRTSEWDDGLLTRIPKRILMYSEMKSLTVKEMYEKWKTITKQFDSKKLIIKPTADGCSTGVVCLESRHEFRHYINSIVSSDEVIKLSQHQEVILPRVRPNCFLLEPYIEIDLVTVSDGQLVHTS